MKKASKPRQPKAKKRTTKQATYTATRPTSKHFDMAIEAILKWQMSIAPTSKSDNTHDQTDKESN